MWLKLERRIACRTAVDSVFPIQLECLGQNLALPDVRNTVRGQ